MNCPICDWSLFDTTGRVFKITLDGRYLDVGERVCGRCLYVIKDGATFTAERVDRMRAEWLKRRDRLMPTMDAALLPTQATASP